MRSNKKRGWTLFNRLAPEKEADELPDPQKIEEQEPAPTGDEMEIEPMAVTEEEPVQLSGDPIQSLFSSLGKFNRHLSQAQHAPDSSEWVEKCMNELAVGLQIAINCNWTPVKDALIDTARILHSYDRVGRRRDSIAFLNGSYDILSLMVGDLIVDKVRSGVIQKWQDLYRKTLDDLRQAGIDLAADEEEMDMEQEAVQDVEESTDWNESPADEEAVNDTEVYEDEATYSEDSEELEASPDVTDDWEHQETNFVEEDVVYEGDALDAASETEEETEETEGAVVDEVDEGEYEEDAVDSGSILTFPGNTTGRSHDAEEDIDETAPVVEEKVDDAADMDDVPKEEPALEERSESPALSPVDREAGLFDGLDAAEDEGECGREELFSDDTVDEKSASVAEEAADISETGEVAENVEESFIGTEDEEPGAEENAFVDEIVPDQETVAEAASDDSPVEANQDVAPAVPGPSHLLHQAQAAVEKGDVRSAKAMALELARTMAEIEYEQAQAAVAELEQRLVDNAQTIKTAQGNVEASEKQLLQTEELLATRDGECGACREQIASMDEELQIYQLELNDIDAQIEALQQRRIEQVNRMNNKQSDREEAVNNESRLQTEMEALRQDTDTIRQDLDALREEKKLQISNKRDIEMAICAAKEESENRRLSLAAIERTLTPRSTVSESPASGDYELFP